MKRGFLSLFVFKNQRSGVEKGYKGKKRKNVSIGGRAGLGWKKEDQERRGRGVGRVEK
jgi:hypothetical protein